MLLPNLPEPENVQEKVVIIGGGLIGLAIARRLMLAGYRDIVVLEREKIAPLTSAHPPENLIHRYHPIEEFRRTLKKSVSLLESFQSSLPTPFFDVTSSLHLATGEEGAGLADKPLSTYPWLIADPQDVPEPFRPDGLHDPFWFISREDGLGSVTQMKDSLYALLEKSGCVSLRYRSEVLDGHREQDTWKLYVSGATVIEADHVIIASGIHSNRVGARLGLQEEPYAVMRRNLFLSNQEFIPDRYGFFQDQVHHNTFRDVNEGTILSTCDTKPVDISTPSGNEEKDASGSTQIGDSYPHLPPIQVQTSWTSLFARTRDRLPIIKHDRQNKSHLGNGDE